MIVEPKSPFYVVEGFISPLMCEDIVDMLDYNIPDQDKDGKDIPSTRSCEAAEEILFNKLQYLLPELQAYYKFIYKGTERLSFEWYPQDTKGEIHAENSTFVRGKWLRTRQRDLTAVLFLSDYQDNIPFDEEFEVYGGKLEFPQHQFGFNPQRGTLIVFPSDPHFINLTAKAVLGDAHQVRFHVAAQTPLLYDPKQFPGDFRKWFAGMV